MQVARWIGQGEGSQINPFILRVDSNFDFNNSFNIRMENNYLAFRNKLNYFKFENMPTILLLGIIVKDGSQTTYYRTEDAIEMTMFLTDSVNYTDGPYILTTENGVHYLLKQQVFTLSEFANEEIIRVEQKVDEHIEDLDNPHGVTAEQVDTYDKLTIDNKDADTLQEAKDYTYSRTDIDNKDTAVLTEAKDYTYSRTDIDNKDINTLQEAKDYTYSRTDIDNKDAAVLTEAKDYTDDKISEEITAEKVKQLYETNPDTNAYTDLEKTKLSGIQAGAQVNPSASDIKTQYESNADTNAFTDALKSKLEGIQAGAQVNPSAAQIKTLYESNANTNAFTDSEKSKLASLESSKFVGQYISLAQLQAAHATAAVGSYAFVDPGSGSDVVKYIWDSSDNKWVLSGEVNQEITAAQVKSLYESNADTNAFTDTEKSKLSGIEAGAQVNTVTSVASKTGDVTLAADDISFSGSGTNYLAAKTEVESAIKELDTRVKANADSKLDKNTNITGATKTKITYDSKGLVTAGADLVEADIPALSPSKITQTASARFVTDAEKTTWNNKVDKVAGKGLSTEDYTSAEKNKLSGIQAGAEVNTVDSVNGKVGAVVLDAEDVGALPDDTPLFSGDYNDLSNRPTIDQLLGNLSTLGFVKRTGTNTYVIDTSTYQPLDADLTAIAGLSGTSGLLRKTASNTWQLDTSVYLTEITKLMVEAVLTDVITTHTHNANDIVEDALHRFVTDTQISTWNNKVDKVAGKGLSTEDYTASEKNKLAGIEVGAQVNTVISVAGKTGIITLTKEDITNLVNATQSISGLMSATDKARLDALYALLEEDTENSVVDSINEILEIFENYPEGADLVSVLANKVDKVAGKGLSTEDYTTAEKNKLNNIEAGAEVNEVNSVNGKIGAVVLTQDDVADGSTYKRVTETEKTTWNNKVDKVAGKGLSENDYTDADKAKVDLIDTSGDGTKYLADDGTYKTVGGSGGEVDLNVMSYFDYAGSIYGAKYSLLTNAWESSLTVDPLEISTNSIPSGPYKGSAQYPDGATEGIIIPHGITSIGNYAFYYNSNNQPLVIPNSVTSIGEYAFFGWTSNNHPLVIPSGVTNIGYSAFSTWTSNNHPLVIPNTVTYIDRYAFSYWSNVPYIEMKSTTPPTLADSTVFSNQNDAPIYVPDASVTAYKTAPNWAYLADRIFAVSEIGGDGGIPEAPNIGGSDGIFYLRDGFSETWVPAVSLYTKADFGDVEIDPYDKTSLSQFITVANPTYSTQAMYYSADFVIYMNTKNVTLVDPINQKQEILTNVFGMVINNEDPKWVAYKDLGSIKYLGTFATSNDAMDHAITNNLPTGIYKAKIESSGGFEVLVNYQRTLTTATATVQSFNSFSVIEVDLTVPEVVRNDMFFVDAHSLPYDNTGSGLLATNVGQAIDELSSKMGDIENALDAILGV